MLEQMHESNGSKKAKNRNVRRRLNENTRGWISTVWEKKDKRVNYVYERVEVRKQEQQQQKNIIVSPRIVRHLTA